MKFQMWSMLHILFIFSPIILLFLLLFLSKNKSFEKKRKIGIITSILAIIILLMRNIEILITSQNIAEIIPLQICHFANFVLLFAFLKNNKSLFAMAFCLNLPAAMMSIIFANSLENYETLFTFRGFAYIFGHMIIVGLTLWAFISGFIYINKKIFRDTLILILALYVVNIFINNIFNLIKIESNYFYIMLPEKGTPLETFYNIGSPVYFIGFKFHFIYYFLTGLLAITIISIFYYIYYLCNKKFNLVKKN